MNNNDEITIILPIYNECTIIKNTINRLVSFISKKYEFNIILADDGSTDQTIKIANTLIKKNKKIRCIRSKINIGRGGIISLALQSCKTKYAVYLDADLQINLDVFPKIIMSLKSGHDIAIGSKHLKNSKLAYPLIRKITSKLYHITTKVLFDCPISDYQCGFKGFNVKKIKKILPLIKRKRWAWDTEILLKAHWAGYSIIEHPAKINLVYSERKSKVKLLTCIFEMAKTVLKVRTEKKEFLERFNAFQKQHTT